MVGTAINFFGFWFAWLWCLLHPVNNSRFFQLFTFFTCKLFLRIFGLFLFLSFLLFGLVVFGLTILLLCINNSNKRHHHCVFRRHDVPLFITFHSGLLGTDDGNDFVNCITRSSVLPGLFILDLFYTSSELLLTHGLEALLQIQKLIIRRVSAS